MIDPRDVLRIHLHYQIDAELREYLGPPRSLDHAKLLALVTLRTAKPRLCAHIPAGWEGTLEWSPRVPDEYRCAVCAAPARLVGPDICDSCERHPAVADRAFTVPVGASELIVRLRQCAGCAGLHHEPEDAA